MVSNLLPVPKLHRRLKNYISLACKLLFITIAFVEKTSLSYFGFKHMIFLGEIKRIWQVDLFLVNL